MARPLCSICAIRPCAINYYDKNKQVHYRSKCEGCITNNSIKSAKPRWAISGYIKKQVCDKCGFRSIYSEQIVVFYVNGDLNNTKINNLRSICLNCIIEVNKKDLLWEQGDLVDDF